MKITVTQKHIERGIRARTRHCPLAIAINEQCPTFEAIVGGHGCRIALTSLSGGSEIMLPLEGAALCFVADFDCGQLKNREYTFDLAIPENVTEPVRSTSVSKRLESEVAAI